MLYIDAHPVADGAPYFVDWDNTDWGSPGARRPTLTATASGTFAVYPLLTNVGERTGRLTLYAQALDYLDKRRVLSEMGALLYGQRTIHLGGRWLSVFFQPGAEVDGEARRSATLAGYTAEFVAPQPFWSLNQPLSGILTPTTPGEEWQLWDDNAIPNILPEFEFTTASFTLTNWGTAFTWAAGTITNGDEGTVYLVGPGSARLAVEVDAGGDGVFLATSEFLLEVGDNAIALQHEDGSPYVPTDPDFVISFGDTYMRFH